MAICMSKCASNVANGTGVKSGVSWVPDGVSCDLFAPQEVEIMVTLFSKLLFYSTVIYWSSSLCYNPTVAVAMALVEVMEHKEGVEVAGTSPSASLPVMTSSSNSTSMACMFWIRSSGRNSRRLRQLKSLLLCSPLLELVTQLLPPLLAPLHLLLLPPSCYSGCCSSSFCT